MTQWMQGFLFAIWLVYILVKDVALPVVAAIRKRSNPVPPDIQADQRIRALEVNLSTQQSRVVELAQALKDHEESTERAHIVTDNKLDMVLAELKDLRDEFDTRLRSLEQQAAANAAHLDHLLKYRRPE